MFEIAWSELFIIAIVAIIVVGPKELPGMLRMLGRMVGKLRRSADEFRRQFDESVREAGGDDLQRELNELRRHNPLNEIRDTIEQAAREATQPALPTPQAYIDKPEEPPAGAATPQAPAEASPQLPPAPAADAAALPQAPAPEAAAPTAKPDPEPAISPGHEPVVNGQHRPLS